MPDLNDTATATLVVDPFGPSTAATLQLFAPDGTDTSPTASSADSNETWTATVVYDQVGWWLLSWTVTGTGAGVTHQRVFVPPAPTAGGTQAYTALEIVKHALNIDADDTTEDSYITGRIEAASRAIDEHCNRVGQGFGLDATATARVVNWRGRLLRDRDGQRLLVPDIGSLDGLVVEVGRAPNWVDVTAAVEAEPTDALVRGRPLNSLLYVGGCWTFNGRVRITAKWGWPRVPAVVSEAALIQTNRLYKRKDSPEGVLGSSEWDGGIRLSRLDPDVAKMLEKLVDPGLA